MEVIERKGVSPVHKDTIRLAEIARSYKKHTILDMGTGTGYIAVFLAREGFVVDATDINEDALECARENRDKHKVQVNIFFSDFFESVMGVYDMIIFNPPIGGDEPSWQVHIKALIRKSIFKNVASKIFSTLMQKKRLPLLRKVIKESLAHLKPEGILLMHIQSMDIEHLNDFQVKVIEKVFEHTSIVEIR